MYRFDMRWWLWQSLRNSVEQSPCWEVDSDSASQEIPRVLCRVKFITCRSQWPHGLRNRNSLRPLEHWDREFETDSRHGRLCMRLFCVCVVACVGSGHATGWSLVQGVLPSYWRRGQGPTKSCRTIDEWMNKIHRRVHKRSHWFLFSISWIHAMASCLFKKQFNIMLQSTTRCAGVCKYMTYLTI
jgi:hypothetical protein